MDIETLLASDSDDGFIGDGLDLETLLQSADGDEKDEERQVMLGLQLKREAESRPSTTYPLPSTASNTTAKVVETSDIVQSAVSSSIPQPITVSSSATSRLFSNITEDDDEPDTDDAARLAALEAEVDASSEGSDEDEATPLNQPIYTPDAAHSTTTIKSDVLSEASTPQPTTSNRRPPTSSARRFDSSNLNVWMGSDGCASLKYAEDRENRSLSYGDSSGSGPSLQLRRTDTIPAERLVSFEELTKASGILRRNVDLSTHGPGISSVISVCSSHNNGLLLALGTTRGQILLMDDGLQETNLQRQLLLPNTLTRPANMDMSTNPFAVTALSFADQSGTGVGLLAAAYRTGDIVLWDCTRGVALRQMRDPRAGEIKSIALIPPLGRSADRRVNEGVDSDTFVVLSLVQLPPQTITTTDSTTGAVNTVKKLPTVLNRIRMSRSMLNSWSQDTDCLLNEGTDPVLHISPLLPLSIADTTQDIPRYVPRGVGLPQSKSEYGDFSVYNGPLQLFALTMARHTCVVQLWPEVKILYKWFIGNNSSTKGSVPTGSSELEEPSVTLLDWSWTFVTCEAPVVEDSNSKWNSSSDPLFLGSYVNQVRNSESAAAEAAATAVASNSLRSANRNGIERGEKCNGVWTPMLTRIRGSIVETLLVRPIFTYADGGAGTPQANTTPAAPVRRSSLLSFASSLGLGSGVAEVPTVSFDFQPYETRDVGGIAATVPGVDTLPSRSGSFRTDGPGVAGGMFQFSEIFRGARWVSATQLLLHTSHVALLLDASLNAIEVSPLPAPMQEALSPSLRSATEAVRDSLSTANASGAATSVDTSSTVLRGGSLPPGAQTLPWVVHRGVTYGLLTENLYRIKLRSRFAQVDRLIKGESKWREALSLVVDFHTAHKDNLLAVERDRVRHYLSQYVGITLHNLNANSGNISDNRIARNVAALCVEFCTFTSNLSFLFGEIREKFKDRADGALLSALEPFICKVPDGFPATGPRSFVASLPPAVISDFLSNAMQNNSIETIQRTVPRFAPHVLDLSTVMRYCYEKRLFAPFMYLYAYGLNDFEGAFAAVAQYTAAHENPEFLTYASPLPDKLVCEMDEDEQRMISASVSQLNQYGALSSDSSPAEILEAAKKAVRSSTDLSLVGDKEDAYRLMVFLRYTFTDRIYPSGREHPHSLSTVWGLLSRLLSERFSHWHAQDTFMASSQSRSMLTGSEQVMTALSVSHFPYLLFLAHVDAVALFVVIGDAIKKVYAVLRHIATATSGEEISDGVYLGSSSSTMNTDGESTNNTPALSSAMETANSTGDAKAIHVLHRVYQFCAEFDTQAPSTKKLLPLFFTSFGSTLSAIRHAAIPQALLLSWIQVFSERRNSQHASEEELLALFSVQMRFQSPESAVALRQALWKGKFYRVAISVRVVPTHSENTDLGSYYLDAISHYITDFRRYGIAPTTTSTGNGDATTPEQDDAGRSCADVFLFINAALRGLVEERIAARRAETVTDINAHEHSLRTAVLSSSLELCSVSLAGTADLIVRNYYGYLNDLLSSTSRDPATQFTLLQRIVTLFPTVHTTADVLQDFFLCPMENSSFSSAHLDDDTVLFVSGSRDRSEALVSYVRLMARQSPKLLRPFFIQYSDCLPKIDWLSIAKEFSIIDAMAYLQEFSGDPAGSLTTLMRELSIVIRQLRNDIDGKLRYESSSAMISTPGKSSVHLLELLVKSGGGAGVDIDSLVDVLPNSVTATHLITCICEVASRRSVTDLEEAALLATTAANSPMKPMHNSDEKPAASQSSRITGHQLWCRALDDLLRERKTLREGTISASTELTAVILSALLRRLVSDMKAHVSPQEVVARVVNAASAAGTRLGEFRDVLAQLMEAHRSDRLTHRLVNGATFHDLRTFRLEKLALMRRATQIVNPQEPPPSHAIHANVLSTPHWVGTLIRGDARLPVYSTGQDSNDAFAVTSSGAHETITPELLEFVSWAPSSGTDYMDWGEELSPVAKVLAQPPLLDCMNLTHRCEDLMASQALLLAPPPRFDYDNFSLGF